MTEQTAETLVRNVWDAYGRGDIEGLLAYADPRAEAGLTSLTR